MARVTKNETTENKRVVRKKKVQKTTTDLDSEDTGSVVEKVAKVEILDEIEPTVTDIAIPIKQIRSIRKIDKRTLKSYCEKTNISYSNDGISLGALLDIFFDRANSMDGRRAKGKFKLDGLEDISDELKQEIENYNDDPYAPKGPIHQADPARYNLYWSAANTWIKYQVQCSRYIAITDVYETLQQALLKVKDLFDNLQDKIDSAFSENPEVQSTVSVWRLESLVSIHEQLLEAIDQFKLESENPERQAKQRAEIEQEADNIREALYDRIEKEKEYELEALEKRLNEEIIKEQTGFNSDDVEDASNFEPDDIDQNTETVLEILR